MISNKFKIISLKMILFFMDVTIDMEDEEDN